MKKQLLMFAGLLTLVTGCDSPEFTNIEATGGNVATGGSSAGAPANTGGTTSKGGSSSTGGSNTSTGGKASSTGGSSSTTGGSATVATACLPGKTQTCECLGAYGPIKGVQACNTAGDALTPCECPAEPSNTGGTSSGTGGSSSFGGSNTSTGGTSSTSGGTSSTGGSATTNMQDCTFSVTSPNDAFSTAFGMTFFMDGGVQQQGSCSGTGTARTCTARVDRSIGTEFWYYTGLTNPGPGAPGWVGTSDNMQAVVNITVSCSNEPSPVPIRISTLRHFRMEPKGSNVIGEDWDKDGVATSQDCDDQNPSIKNCTGTGGTGSTGKTQVTFDVFGASVDVSPLQFMPTGDNNIGCSAVFNV